MNVIRYLHRINSEHLQSVSEENLSMLHANHLEAIPFENIETTSRRRVDLNLEAIYEKVVVNRRGGFCFELNYLFSWLLNELGYNCSLIPSRVYSPVSLGYSPWFSHVAIKVKFQDSGKEFLADVGFTVIYKSPIRFECNFIF